MPSKIEIGLKARRSKDPCIRELGQVLMGKGNPNKLKDLYPPTDLMPSQEKLISEILEHLNVEDYLAKHAHKD